MYKGKVLVIAMQVFLLVATLSLFFLICLSMYPLGRAYLNPRFLADGYAIAKPVSFGLNYVFPAGLVFAAATLLAGLRSDCRFLKLSSMTLFFSFILASMYCLAYALWLVVFVLESTSSRNLYGGYSLHFSFPFYSFGYDAASSRLTNVKLHSVDYPPEMQEQWRRRAEAGKRNYDQNVAEAGRIRTSLIDCMKRHGLMVPSIKWPM